MTCISLSNLIAIFQLIVSVFVGIATIVVYFRITTLSNINNRDLAELNSRNNLFKKINSDLDRIAELTIHYPYFDDPEYKNQYQNDLQSNNSKKRENAFRYNAFAIMNYNFVEDLFTFYKGDLDEMENYCDFKELISDHKYYWQNLSNQEKNGYHKIKSLIETIIAESEKTD